MVTTQRTESPALRCDLGLVPGTPEWRAEHVWPRVRQLALSRDLFRCVDCGTEDWDTVLEVHHLVPVSDYAPHCGHHLAGVVTVCPQCHRERHRVLRSGQPMQRVLALAV